VPCFQSLGEDPELDFDQPLLAVSCFQFLEEDSESESDLELTMDLTADIECQVARIFLHMVWTGQGLGFCTHMVTRYPSELEPGSGYTQ
jgi:hypothetical protein